MQHFLQIAEKSGSKKRFFFSLSLLKYNFQSQLLLYFLDFFKIRLFPVIVLLIQNIFVRSQNYV